MYAILVIGFILAIYFTVERAKSELREEIKTLEKDVSDLQTFVGFTEEGLRDVKEDLRLNEMIELTKDIKTSNS